MHTNEEPLEKDMAKTAELDMGWLLTGKTSDTHAAALERAAGAKIMNFVLKRGILYQNHTKTRNSVSKTRNFAFKMMDFAFKMMDFAAAECSARRQNRRRRPEPCANRWLQQEGGDIGGKHP